MMNKHQIDINAISLSASRLDTVIECLMIVLLAFMPLAFGVVHAWSEMVVITLTGAMALCLALKLAVRKDTGMVWTWAYVPMAMFLLLVVLQLLPLPVTAAKIISPGTVETKTTLLEDLPLYAGGTSNVTASSISTSDVLDQITLSFYPQATEHDLRLILAAAVIFVVIVNVYRRPEQIKRLMTAIMIIGGGIALLALAQDLLGNGKIYWRVSVPNDQANSGPFVNHSHYGQFMNLSIGAALGLLLVKIHEAFRQRKFSLSSVIARLGERDMRLTWYCLGMIILGAATIFLSLTRGGMVSMLIAGSFTALVIAFKRGLKGNSWIITVFLLGSFVCVLYIGYDAVYDRLATLRDLNQAQSGRGQILKDIALAWTRFPGVGTGLGTHDVVYPMFDRSTIASLAGHAENEYAQAAEETGGVGLALLIMFAIIVWSGYGKNLGKVGKSKGGLSIHSAAFGLGFGLLAIMIHSLSDFGQHLPANAGLSVVSCGLLISMARMTNDPPVTNNNPRRSFLKMRKVFVVGVAGVWFWALLGANGARCGESDWNRARLLEDSLSEKDWLGSNEEYTEILSHAVLATSCQPKNVKYRHWLNVYRWRAISRVTDPNSGELILTPDALQFTQQIVDELHQARVLCPTFGATYCLIGQLEYFVLENSAGAQQIRTGYKLAPCDATTCFIAGLLDTQEEKMDESLEKFRRAIDLNGSFISDVIDVYVHRINRPDLAVALAQDDINRLSRVARALSDITEHQELADQARIEVATLLKEKCAQPDAPASALASLAYVYQREKDYSAAAEYFRRALALDYSQVHWHLALARTLAELGQISEAIHEARIVLRLRPQMAAAKKLIEDLSTRSETTVDK